MTDLLHFSFVIGFVLTIAGAVCGVLPVLSDEPKRGDSLLPKNMELSNKHKEDTLEFKIVWRLRGGLHSWTDKRLYTLAFGLILFGTIFMSLRELLQ